MTARLEGISVDVCVAGAGFAGLCAALAAAEQGARVLLLERSAEPGGLLRRSAGMINAFDPRRQFEMGLNDSPERHLHDVLKFGNLQNQTALARRLCYGAYDAVSWLEAHGVRFAPKLRGSLGSSVPRGHLPEGGRRGESYMAPLLRALRAAGVDIRFEAALVGWSAPDASGARQLSIERRRGGSESAAGREVRMERIRSRALILCGGGFSGNRTKLSAMAPFLSHAAVINPEADGSLLDLAVDFGAGTVGESFVLAALCAVDRRGQLQPASSLPAPLRNPAEFLLVSRKGRRFVREDASTELLRLAVAEQDGSAAALIAPDRPGARASESASDGVAKAATLSALAAQLALPPDELLQTVARYEAGAAAGHDEFGRDPSILLPLAERARQTGWIGARICAAVLTTTGGLVLGPSLEVMSRRLRPMPGIFAAGDIVGGIHGTTPALGNLLASAAVFGMAAGRAAGRQVKG